MSNVTVLGLGAMGSRMAANLLSDGHKVTVWNRTPLVDKSIESLGAIGSVTPRAAVADADFVISMLSDDAASREVWLDPDVGALAFMKKNAMAIESSTLSSAWVRELSSSALNAGIPFLDACVSGSRPQVEARQLVYFVGGSQADFNLASPILTSAGGSKIHHVGGHGAGSAVKLATNVLLGAQTVAIAEALSLLELEGVDAIRALDVIATTFVCSPFVKGVGTLMLNQSFAPMFTTKLVQKDMQYALDAGQSLMLPLITTVQNVFKNAAESGWGDDNLTSVVKLYHR